MPRILAKTPSWLSRGSPGFNFFDASSAKKVQSDGDIKETDLTLPLRSIARRKTEIFAVVGNELHWAELVNLKELGEIDEAPGSQQEEIGLANRNRGYKEIECRSIYGGIKQLLMSPGEELLAIVGSHMVNVIRLPQSERLDNSDFSTVKPRQQYQLGRMVHIHGQSPIASVLWHPLGISGQCLITITQDAVVRMWELNFDDRTSFDEPTLSFDLARLAAATTADEDIQGSARRKKQSNSFSSYDADFQLAAASFGGSGASGESPWSSMTLWMATQDGDIYALCPLLPSRWQAAQRLTEGALFLASAQSLDDGDGNPDLTVWAQQLNAQQPLHSQYQRGDSSPEAINIFLRPTTPGSVPALQGPFVLTPETQEWDLEISDIIVMDLYSQGDISLTVENQDAFGLLSDIDEGAGPAETPVPLVTIATVAGNVYVSMCLEGVEPQWLPPKRPSAPSRQTFEDILSNDNARSDRQLLAFHQFSIGSHAVKGTIEKATFTSDLYSPFAAFVTHSTGVSYFSLTHFMHGLREEMESSGNEMRIDMLLDNAAPLVEQLLNFRPVVNPSESRIPSVLVLQDSDLGYFILTTQDDEPYAAQLDTKIHGPVGNGIKQEEVEKTFEAIEHNLATEMGALSFAPPQDPYQPDPAFYRGTNVDTWKRSNAPNLNAASHKQVRLSNETLADLTHIHRLLSEETNNLSRAAADLFRRCEALQEEFRGQIRTVNDVAAKVENLGGPLPDPDDDERIAEGNTDLDFVGTDRISQQIDAAISRRSFLLQRRRDLQSKVTRLQRGAKQMSEKEKAWSNEVDDASRSVGLHGLSRENEGVNGEGRSSTGNVNSQAATKDSVGAEGGLLERYNALKSLETSLLESAKAIRAAQEQQGSSAANGAVASGGDSPGSFRSSSPRVGGRFRKQKEAVVRELLNREEAMIEAVKERVEKLTGRSSAVY